MLFSKIYIEMLGSAFSRACCLLQKYQTELKYAWKKKMYLLTIKSLQGKYMGKHVGYEAAVRCSRGLTQEWEDLPSGPALPTTCRASLHVPDWSVLIWFWGRACPFACRAMSIGQLCPLTCGSAGSLLHVAIS